MRYINKGAEPRELTHRRGQLIGTPNLGGAWYDQLEGNIRDAIKAQCLQEQGFLCAYTGLRIEMTSSHIEHMWPRSQCSPDEQIDYKNLIACYNGPKDKHPGFGAKMKDNWPSIPERPLLVRPTDPSCESRFVYQANGHVIPSNASDTAAKETIDKLVLSDEENTELVGWRRAALLQLRRLEKVEEVRDLIVELKQPNNKGQFEQFAFIKQRYLETRLKSLAARRKYAALSKGAPYK